MQNKEFVIMFDKHKIKICAEDPVEAATSGIEKIYKEEKEMIFPGVFGVIESKYIGTEDEGDELILLNAPLILANAGLYSIATELQKKIDSHNKKQKEKEEKE